MDKKFLFKLFIFPAEKKHTIELASLYSNNPFLKGCPLNRDYQLAYLKISSFLLEGGQEALDKTPF
jgi:hypothetical protein